MRTRLLSAVLFLVALSSMTLAQSSPPDDTLVNLDHLRFLTETVEHDGEPVAIVHIYSEYPEFEWVDAAGEGISAVDDVARAAIVYLWQYERTGDESLLDLARAGLNFVMMMQADDGEFYNFVYDRDLQINRNGNTSYKSLTWWAMRGFWSLGEGVRVFDSIDPAYADTLSQAYLKTQTALARSISSYGEMTSVHGFDVPSWIPGGESTVASIGLLGLSAYYRARPNDATAEVLTQIADGVSAYRLGDDVTYPFGMHPARSNAPGFWHTWGAHMAHALVEAGMTLDRQDWIDSAAASADSFLLRQLAFERFRHIGVIPDRLNQIAYGTNQLVLAYTSLYQATGEQRYAQYAGLAGSWYFGNNMAGVPMYDPATGRVLDGIDGPVSWRINRNSGAESTIEGLMSMIVLDDIAPARDLLDVTTTDDRGYFIFEAESGERVVGTPVYYSATWTGEGYVSAGRYVGIGEGQRMRLQFDVDEAQAGDYWLYAAQMRQSAISNSALIKYAEVPPVIDGSEDDWLDDVPLLASDTARQFVRGAGLWQGADVDSHRIRLMWDADNLYIFADINDPQHEQPYTLSTVWQGDTLWFYMANQADAQRLTSKFTLAETPDGPQAWDWLNTGFLAGVQMMFRTKDNGYVYEASVSWSSLKMDAPQAGSQIGLEVGRGVGGNAFMDLTGRDPDVAANLLTVTLVDGTTSMDEVAPPAVALEVRLNDGDAQQLQQTVSPDADYFWLERVTEEPVTLQAGEHTIRYRYHGEQDENPGLAKVDAFLLQPVTAHRVFTHPDGRTLTLTYDTSTGEASLQENNP